MASEPILRLEEHDKVMSCALLSLPMLLMQADTLQADDSKITTTSSNHVDQACLDPLQGSCREAQIMGYNGPWLVSHSNLIPINKQLYSFSYVCFTAMVARIVFIAFYMSHPAKEETQGTTREGIITTH
ncbi:hypothetical protein Tco_1232454 [Tanacetum coccineum]